MTKRVYQCDAAGYLVGTTYADESPLEPGQHLIPGGCVEMAPPELMPGQVARWIAGEWTVEPDLRGTRYWLADGSEHEITEPGITLPVDATMEPPQPTVSDVATDRFAEISTACESAITGGFMSEALGTPHAYQSDRDDQLNLVGAVSANADIPFKCLDGNTSVWAYRPHTAAQLKQVLADGAAVKLGHLQRFGQLRDQVQAIVAATTLLPDDPGYMDDATARAALDAVEW